MPDQTIFFERNSSSDVMVPAWPGTPQEWHAISPQLLSQVGRALSTLQGHLTVGAFRHGSWACHDVVCNPYVAPHRVWVEVVCPSVAHAWTFTFHADIPTVNCGAARTLFHDSQPEEEHLWGPTSYHGHVFSVGPYRAEDSMCIFPQAAIFSRIFTRHIERYCHDLRCDWQRQIAEDTNLTFRRECDVNLLPGVLIGTADTPRRVPAAARVDF